MFPSSWRKPGPITTGGSIGSRWSQQASCAPIASWRYGWVMDPLAFARTTAGINFAGKLRLALGVEHRGRQRLARRLAGPDHELECREVEFPGVVGAGQHALSLCDGGDQAAVQHQRLPVHDHAGVGPQIEMADPQLLV